MAADTAKLLDCDAVFRGGITSGVIYPGAVAALARRYRLRSIGGGSAGAIAAGVAAAAEYGRTMARRETAFAELAETAAEVSGGKGSLTSLTSLFRPWWFMWPVYRLFLVAQQGLLKGLALFLALPVLGALACGGWNAWLGSGWQVWLGAGFHAFTASTLAMLLLLVVWVLVVLPRAGGFGLCPGINPGLGRRQSADRLRRRGALMDWMHGTMQLLAGRTAGQVLQGAQPAPQDQPLTMADLWGGQAERQIDLRLTTTNLTQQLPHSFPFLEREMAELYFCAEELARIMPRDVVRWMVLKARPGPETELLRRSGVKRRLYRLPEPQHLPVLFGVRLSLSFPGLLAAVPLWAASYDEEALAASRDTAELKPTRLVRCWFSDGGITSNFPISSFDSALPTWPTFGFDLRAATPEQAAAGPRDAAGLTPGQSPDPLVVLAMHNDGGMPPRAISDIGHSLTAFLGAIVDTARNGRENELMLLPGYRDRIVHIAQREDEGGLNLSMPDATIKELSKRGETAARLLVERFDPASALNQDGGFHMNGDNHYWVRYRALLAALEKLLAELREGHRQPDPAARAYPWPDDRAEAARQTVAELLELAERMEQRARSLTPPGEAPTLFDQLNAAGGRQPPGNSPRAKLGLALQPIGRDPARTMPYR